MPTNVYKAVCNRILLEDSTDLCCLCMSAINGDGTFVHDEVVLGLSPERGVISEGLVSILRFLIGETVADTLKSFKYVCKQCTVSAINSFKFIQNAIENYRTLIKAVKNIEKCLEGIISNDFYNKNTLYVAISRNNLSEQHRIKLLWDKNHQSHKSSALSRFKILNSKQNIENKNKKKKSYAKIRCKTNIPTRDLLHDPEAPHEYKCKICLKVYPTSIGLRGHFFRVHLIKDYPCQECHKVFATSQKLNAHFSLNHSTKECPECGETILNKMESIKEHEMKHLGKYSCHDCNRIFKQLWFYNKHKARKTCNDRRKGDFICDHCGYHALYKFALTRHIKFEHRGVKGYVCKWCAKNCYTPSALKMHLRKHTKEKEFLCIECGGTFVNLYSLNNHTKRHTGERPYPCRHCERAFKNASMRLEHERRFHTEASLECDICHQMFKAKASLLRHKNRHLNSNSRLNQNFMNPQNNV